MSLFDDLDADQRRRLGELAETLAERRSLAPADAVLAVLEEALDPPATGGDGPPELPGFEVRLFGHPRVLRHAADGTVREVEWRLRRSLGAFLYLALAPGRRATKEELVEAMWPRASAETVAKTVEKNFHPTLSDLRRSLSGGTVSSGDRATGLPTVEYGSGVYALTRPQRWRIDVDIFEELLDEAAAARRAGEAEPEVERLEAAWRLYHGPLAAEIEAPWLAERRAELRRAWLAALERLGEVAANLGRDVLALDAWRRLLIEEPFEERVHLGVMELYGRRGRRDLVRRQYVKLQEHLADLEVEPAKETQRRYLELMG